MCRGMPAAFAIMATIRRRRGGRPGCRRPVAGREATCVLVAAGFQHMEDSRRACCPFQPRYGSNASC